MIYIAPKSRRNQGACGCWMEFSESTDFGPMSAIVLPLGSHIWLPTYNQIWHDNISTRMENLFLINHSRSKSPEPQYTKYFCPPWTHAQTLWRTARKFGDITHYGKTKICTGRLSCPFQGLRWDHLIEIAQPFIKESVLLSAFLYSFSQVFRCLYHQV